MTKLVVQTDSTQLSVFYTAPGYYQHVDPYQ